MSINFYGAEYDPVKKWNYLVEEFYSAIENEDWEKVSTLIALNPNLMEQGLEYVYQFLPPEYKFSIPVNCYTHNGDKMPGVRKYVRQARKWVSLERRLPADLIALPEITVYRAGAEPVTQAANYISWTTDPAVARWFYDRAIYRKQPTRHIYRGVIVPEKVIWYTDDRKEKEIMQYRNVRQIVELDPETIPQKDIQERGAEV